MNKNEYIHMLNESRDPTKAYRLEEVRGKVERIVLTLEGKESAAYTKLAKRYKELDSTIKELSEERDAMNQRIRNDILETYFDAEDAVLTRVIETVSLTAQLAKTSAPKPKIDNDKVVVALMELMPELKDKVEALQEQFTSIPKERAPSLTVKINEGVKDVWDKFKDKLSSFLSKMNIWGQRYDTKLDRIRQKLAALNESVRGGRFARSRSLTEASSKFVLDLYQGVPNSHISYQIESFVKDGLIQPGESTATVTLTFTQGEPEIRDMICEYDVTFEVKLYHDEIWMVASLDPSGLTYTDGKTVYEDDFEGTENEWVIDAIAAASHAEVRAFVPASSILPIARLDVTSGLE